MRSPESLNASRIHRPVGDIVFGGYADQPDVIRSDFNEQRGEEFWARAQAIRDQKRRQRCNGLNAQSNSLKAPSLSAMSPQDQQQKLELRQE